jgi:hypothetical protein
MLGLRELAAFPKALFRILQLDDYGYHALADRASRSTHAEFEIIIYLRRVLSPSEEPLPHPTLRRPSNPPAKKSKIKCETTPVVFFSSGFMGAWPPNPQASLRSS